MAVYDMAHRLAKSLKESDEYSTYSKLRREVMENEDTKKMIRDFQKEQMKLQAKQLSGEELSEDEKERFNKLREIVDLNVKAKKYLEAEYRMGVLFNDLQRIIFGDLEIGLNEEKDNNEA